VSLSRRHGPTLLAALYNLLARLTHTLLVAHCGSNAVLSILLFAQSITWHVEWRFAGTQPEVVLSRGVHEDTTLRQALRTLLLPPQPPSHPAQNAGKGTGGAAAGVESNNAKRKRGEGGGGVDAATRHALRHVIATLSPEADGGDKELLFLLPKVGVPACDGALWVSLDPDVAMKHSLAGAWLVEFPALTIVLPPQAPSFTVTPHRGPEPAPKDNKWL
jgi:hypothetical protein